MFGSSAVSLMLMLLLCFMGMLIMFLFILRALADHKTSFENSCAQIDTALAEIEQQLLDLDFLVRQTNENHQEKGASTDNLNNIPQNISELFPPTGYAENTNILSLQGDEQENGVPTNHVSASSPSKELLELK